MLKFSKILLQTVLCKKGKNQLLFRSFFHSCSAVNLKVRLLFPWVLEVFSCTIYCLFFFIKSLTLNINQLFVYLHHWSDLINWLWFIWGKKSWWCSVWVMKCWCNSVDPLLEKLRKNYAALEENGEKTKIFLFLLLLGKSFLASLCAYSFACGSWLEDGL